jgi:hypothetical protein
MLLAGAIMRKEKWQFQHNIKRSSPVQPEGGRLNGTEFILVGLYVFVNSLFLSNYGYI